MSIENLKPIVRLSIHNPSTDRPSVFGPGIAALCEGVRDSGSLNAAAKQMHMAYSKAWRIVKDTEETLGVQLLDRDGAHGSTLTAEGAALLDAYAKVTAAINEEAEKLFAAAIAQ